METFNQYYLQMAKLIKPHDCNLGMTLGSVVFYFQVFYDRL